MPERRLALNCQVSWENGPLGAVGWSASLAEQNRKFLPSDRRKEACLRVRGVQLACSQTDPVPSCPPSLRKLRPVGCPGEVAQLGSWAESGLIGQALCPSSLASGA